MNKTKITLVTMAMGVFATLSTYAQVVSAPVLEAIQSSSFVQQISQYLTAIDTLYSNYDMVMNTITQIENQYRTIQQAVERAKSIDWDNIHFDGDFDIRNDIRDANMRVNKLLTQARTIKSALNTNIIRAPGSNISYSLADLCGAGDENKDLFTAAADIGGYMTDNMRAAADAAVKDISPEQGAAIMAKYGISPRNYWYALRTENQLKTAVGNAIAAATETAQQMEIEDADSKTNAIVNAALETLDSDGNPTEGALSMASMMLLRNLSSQLSDLKLAFREGIGLSSKKMLAEMNEKEARAATELEATKMQEYTNNRAPASFTAGNRKSK